MRLLLLSLLASLSLVSAVPTTRDAEEYDYVVVGSGAGGGPLACRLARNGYKTLLIEAGGNPTGNVNVSVPGYQAVVTQDPTLRWDIFVNHYQDQNRAKRDPKYTYEVGPYQYHVGPNPPPGAKELGILYPRASGLGGCITHNALIWILPHKSDWNDIATLTGDNSWAATNMNQYLDRVNEWLPHAPTDPTILLRDLPLAQHLLGGASAIGVGPAPLDAIPQLANLLLQSPNNRLNPARDSAEGYFQIPLIQKFGSRVGVLEYITRTVEEGFPLTVQTDTFVTKITFDKSSEKPKANGVEFLQGEYLYRASPLHRPGYGRRGSVTAKKEVIISAGTFNTVQLLKLSGIGGKDELQRFDIPVVKDLPGVGTNMMDRYEIPVNVKHPKDFSILDGCTFDLKDHDKCLKQWQSNPYILGARGAYGTNGLAAAMAKRSDFATTSDIDLYVFGGPINFQGYFPYWGDFAVRDHQHFSWYTLKAHTKNHAGTVELRSKDPLDPPLINFNYFDTGTTAGGADKLDVSAIVQAIRMSRQALSDYNAYKILGGTEFVEENPGPEMQTDEQLETYIKDRAWGHHASCSCPIGPEDDPMAVLDSEFRVRGVDNLRVVDASIFPKIPGIFIQSAIFMASEKAADVIMAANKEESQ
ncbi:alcohol oxidase [Delitschia confertaspora ATCC 74209]|uniref:Alcohol oxidase n=1 Tax=Delitschia confertaspora ATCC 74209 TaxID=1513339 RepID=A0A9P4MPN3_9PLEO|nr:alcohol oxidase [Delitschia confertaspora ATCC 74209]